MSVLSALFDNKTYNFEQAFHAKDVTSPAMRTAIRAWFDLYFDGEAPDDMDRCQRLPVVIVNKLYKTAFSEYVATIGSTGAKADFMSDLLTKLDRVRKTAMQMALVGGECFVKPVLSGKSLDFTVVRRDCFIPLARGTGGRITSVGTAEFTSEGGKYYTLLERRTVNRGGFLTIESKLYQSSDRSMLGSQVPLGTLGKYAALEPVLTLPQPVGNLGMAPLVTPMLNVVDGSEDAVAVYAAAVGLIRNVDRNERQLDDEFKNGKSRIIASADMMERDGEGRKRIKDDVFTAVDDDPETVGITIFSPALREQSYLARKQEYLRNVESLIGLKRGILTEVEAAERTATEITSSAGDYNLTIVDFQQSWETMLRELLATCDALGQMYKLCDGADFDPEKDLVIDWGDGVLYDRDKAWQEYVAMVGSGMLKPELALAWYFNLPHETPADFEKIRTDYMPELEAMVGGEV